MTRLENKLAAMSSILQQLVRNLKGTQSSDNQFSMAGGDIQADTPAAENCSSPHTSRTLPAAQDFLKKSVHKIPTLAKRTPGVDIPFWVHQAEDTRKAANVPDSTSSPGRTFRTFLPMNPTRLRQKNSRSLTRILWLQYQHVLQRKLSATTTSSILSAAHLLKAFPVPVGADASPLLLVTS
jgi:hypothetical protein